MGLPTLELQTSFRVFASNVRGLKEQTVSVAQATYPVSGFQSQEPSTAVGGRPRAWGFWASLAWFGAAVVAAFMAVSLCIYWWVITHPRVPAPPTLKDLWVAIFMTMVVLVLAVAARRAGWKARDYLALVVLPKLHHVLIGCGSLVAFWVFVAALADVFPSLDQSEVMTKIGRAHV